MTQLCSFPRNRNVKAVCMRNFLPDVTGTALLVGKIMWVFVKSWTFSLKRKCVTVEKMTKKLRRNSRKTNTTIFYFWRQVINKAPGFYLHNCRSVILNTFFIHNVTLCSAAILFDYL